MLEVEEEINKTPANEKEIGSEVYELGYLLVPTISEEDLPMQYGNLKELLGSLGALVISDEMPKIISLTYGMQKVIANIRHKFTNAYFGWVKFTLDKTKMAELKKKLDLSDNLVRFLIVKTVRENTIASKRFGRDDGRKFSQRKTSDEASAAPLDKEKVDQEIDALVAAN